MGMKVWGREPEQASIAWRNADYNSYAGQSYSDIIAVCTSDAQSWFS